MEDRRSLCTEESVSRAKGIMKLLERTLQELLLEDRHKGIS